MLLVAKEIQQERGLQLQGYGSVGRDIAFQAPSSLPSAPNADVMVRAEAASMTEASEQRGRESRSQTSALPSPS